MARLLLPFNSVAASTPSTFSYPGKMLQVSAKLRESVLDGMEVLKLPRAQGSKISRVCGRPNFLLTSVNAMSSTTADSLDSSEEPLPLMLAILRNIDTNIQAMKDGKDTDAESSQKILRHLSHSVDEYLRTDVRSTEQEVSIVAHAFLKELYGELVDEPELNHLVRDKQGRKRLAELDGYICIGNNLVGIVETKRHVKEVDVTALLMKSAITLRMEGFSNAILFIGGPLIDKRAKKYAQEEGIHVVGLSGNRYSILDAEVD